MLRFSDPPPNWERIVPRYRAVRAVYPSPNRRHRLEPPFASVMDSDVWQYAERPFEAREEIETRAWPHSSFCPLNYSASRVLDFFCTRMKSRLPLAPWRNGRIDLEDSLTGPTQPNISINSGVTAA